MITVSVEISILCIMAAPNDYLFNKTQIIIVEK